MSRETMENLKVLHINLCVTLNVSFSTQDTQEFRDVTSLRADGHLPDQKICLKKKKKKKTKKTEEKKNE